MSVPFLDAMADDVARDGRPDITLDDESASSPSTTRRCARPPAIDCPRWIGAVVVLPSLLPQYEFPRWLARVPRHPRMNPTRPHPFSFPSATTRVTTRPLFLTTAKIPSLRTLVLGRLAAAPSKRRRVQDTGARQALCGFGGTRDRRGREDDEMEEDMAGFIDDDPIDDEPVHHPEDIHRERWRRVPESHRRERESEARNLENEAKRYEDMARQAVFQIQRSKLPSTRWSRNSPIPLTRPSSNLRVHSAFTRGDGSRSVYAETVDLFLLRKALTKYAGAYRMHPEAPIELTLEERVHALTFPPFDSPVGRWVRVISGTLLYKNDIVFVMDDSQYLAIPRVPYTKAVDNTDCAPRAARQAQQVLAVGAERRFQSGLEHRTWKPSYLSLEDAVPSDRERALFAESGHSALRATSFTGRCCALHEGDFVVVMKHKDPQTKRDRLVRVAALLERYNSTDGISKKSLESKDNPSFAVPIRCLRLHILATPRPLAIDDRVLVVAGPSQGSFGRIEFFGNDVEMRHVQRAFRVCDMVEIIRGPKKGTPGFVVEVHTGGFVVFYPCTFPQIFNAMDEPENLRIETIENIPFMKTPTTWNWLFR
ncbi:hypothetical protein B0H13DRAFT_2379761 [Mycena leptocephala]|nr:hypothetical protein B0H13DRAFT_2379761 [Mycena leptocephala]